MCEEGTDAHKTLRSGMPGMDGVSWIQAQSTSTEHKHRAQGTT
jgi:hypothetical protein